MGIAFIFFMISYKYRSKFLNLTSESDVILTNIISDDIATKIVKNEKSLENRIHIIDKTFDCHENISKNEIKPVKSVFKKRAWTRSEDKLLKKLVRKYGLKKWAEISKKIQFRDGKQCRERWHNHLNPMVKRCSWSEKEEWLLYLCHKYFGNKWSAIAKIIRGRPDNSIKNHWNCYVKKHISVFDEKFQIFLNKHNLGSIENMTANSELLVHLKEEIRLTKYEVKDILSISSDKSVKKEAESFESRISIDKNFNKKKLFLSDRKIKNSTKDQNLSLDRSRINLSDYKMSAQNDSSLAVLNVSKDSLANLNILDELEPSSEAQLLCIICENSYCKCF